jgi:hypothetical protein
MAVFRSGFAMRRRGFLLLTLLAFALALGAGGILWQSVESSSVSEVRTRIDALKPVFDSFRLGLIVMLAISWPLLVKGLHRWGRINEAQTITFLALHWRVVTWMVVIELALGQNLLGQVMAVWQEGRA